LSGIDHVLILLPVVDYTNAVDKAWMKLPLDVILPLKNNTTVSGTMRVLLLQQLLWTPTACTAVQKRTWGKITKLFHTVFNIPSQILYTLMPQG
jgi:hypothetical protein